MKKNLKLDETPLGRLYKVPELPPHFLPRPNEIEQLKDKLLTSLKPAVAITGPKYFGVEGIGGIGKSVLAASLAQNLEIRQAFPDGVFWLTVGKEPSLKNLQFELAIAFGINLRAGANEQEIKSILSQSVESKTLLLILDDVWDVQHLEEFQILGSNSRMLVTTRQKKVTVGLEAYRHPLELLSDDQAKELLAKGTGLEKLPDEAPLIIKQCGKIPLALAMVGAMLREKPLDSWKNVLHKLENAELTKIEQQFPNYQDHNLFKTLQVSIDELESDLQKRYLDFAVFPEDAPIPEAVLRTLWEADGLNECDTQDYIDKLVDCSLARRDVQANLSLHDFQLDYVRKQVVDLSSLHNRLLEAYKTHCKKGWSNGPDDGYFFDHLIYHLEQAKRAEEIHQLLQEETNEGKNSWYEAQAKRVNIARYLTDVKIALELVKKAQTDSFHPQNLGRQCLYGLMIASINSLANNISEELIVKLVKHNKWNQKQGLTYALQITKPKQKVDTLIKLAPHLQKKLRDEALTQALETLPAILDEDEWVEALTALGDKIPEALLPKALEAALAIKSEHYRAEVLKALGNKLPEALLPKALEAALAIKYEHYRADVLMALGDKLPKALPLALEAALAIKYEWPRAEALKALVDKLPEALLPKAFEAALAIKSEQSRAKVLTALGDKLPKALPLALEAALAIKSEQSRADVLMALGDKLPKALPLALEAALAIEDEYYRADVLMALGDKLPEALLPKALEATLAIKYEWPRAEALTALGDKLPEALLPKALEAALALENEKYRAEALTALIPKLEKLSNSVLFNFLQETAERFCLQNRQHSFKNLEVIIPIIFKLGSLEAIEEVFQAIELVTRWWP